MFDHQVTVIVKDNDLDRQAMVINRLQFLQFIHHFHRHS